MASIPYNDQSKTLKEIIKIIKELAQRIRMIEERISKIENAINELNTKLHDELQIINEYKTETNNRLNKLEVDTTNQAINIKNIERKLKEYARKTELRELKEYIDLIKPINKIYVTRKELKEIMKRENMKNK